MRWLAIVLAATASTAPLDLHVTKLRNDRGRVGCALWASAQGFPKDRAAALRTGWCDIVRHEAHCTFDALPSGSYAAVCFHDENGNGKLDTKVFGIPTEGLAISNHAQGFLGPPKFEDAKFTFAGVPSRLRLETDY